MDAKTLPALPIRAQAAHGPPAKALPCGVVDIYVPDMQYGDTPELSCAITVAEYRESLDLARRPGLIRMDCRRMRICRFGAPMRIRSHRGPSLNWFAVLLFSSMPLHTRHIL